ncbi:MAG: hypothetical protein R8K50_06160 [Mariprofundus sp.]
MCHAAREIRTLTNDFPNLLMPDGRPVSSIEIDVDSFTREENYQFGGWNDLMRSITAAWVTQHAYDGTGTIWQWGSPSVNFGHCSYSMFYAVLGMPQSFRKYLSAEIRELGDYVRPHSDEVIPALADGWDTMCHVEDRKVWEPLDPTLWQKI